MSSKEYWDTMNPYDRQKNFPSFNPATYGARWAELERDEQRIVYKFKESNEKVNRPSEATGENDG